MRRLRRTISDLQRTGPIIEMTVEPVLAVQRVLRKNEQPIPTISLMALIDTGATVTTIQTAAVERLGLLPLGTVFMNTPSTTEPIPCFEYRVRLILGGKAAFETDAVAAPLGHQNVQCLIGRDILRYAVLTYNGPKNSYSLNIQTVEEE